MYMPLLPLLARGRPRRASGARRVARRSRGSRSTPFAAIRSRPMFSCSSRSAQLLGVDARRRAAAPLLGLEVLDERRRAGSGSRGPGPLSSSDRVARRRSPPAGTRRDRAALGRLAREQVGGAHQHADADAALGAAARPAAATIAAERASWMPPANSTWQSRARRAGSSSSSTRSSCPRARSSCAARRGRRTRAPRRRSGARRRRRNSLSSPARARAGRSGCPRPRARAPGRAGRRRSARTAGGARG